MVSLWPKLGSKVISQFSPSVGLRNIEGNATFMAIFSATDVAIDVIGIIVTFANVLIKLLLKLPT